jgi:hypothetical protein
MNVPNIRNSVTVDITQENAMTLLAFVVDTSVVGVPFSETSTSATISNATISSGGC